MFLDRVIELQMSHYRFGDKRLQERCFFFTEPAYGKR